MVRRLIDIDCAIGKYMGIETDCGDCIRCKYMRSYKFGPQHYHLSESTEKVLKRQEGKCADCGRDLQSHIAKGKPARAYYRYTIPKFQGGTDNPNNLELVCPWCLAESDETPRILASSEIKAQKNNGAKDLHLRVFGHSEKWGRKGGFPFYP